MHAMRITPETLEVVAAMNDGMQPLIQSEPTYFVWFAQDKHARIVTANDFKVLSEKHDLAPVDITVWKP